MLVPVNRRTVLSLLTAGACASAVSFTPHSAWADAEDPIATIEARHGGRLGVFALDTQTGRQLAHRADERFLMCSMFKLPLAAAVLARVDAGELRLSDQVPYTAGEIPGVAPVTRAHLVDGKGSLSVAELCAAVVEVSDNGGANLLLAKIGGPQGYTRFVRAQGDPVTRLDRIELAMNTASGDRDTTSPRAFVALTQKLLLGDTLHPGSRERLLGWVLQCQTGKDRLRAGMPVGWKIGDKTGTGDTETNDTAIAWPPGHSPVIVAALYNATTPSADEREAVLKEVGAVVGRWAAAGS